MRESKKWSKVCFLGVGLLVCLAAIWMVFPRSAAVKKVSSQVAEMPQNSSQQSLIATSETANSSSSQSPERPSEELPKIDVVIFRRVEENLILQRELPPGADWEDVVAKATDITEIGYDLADIKVTEVNNELTRYELAFGERTKNWDSQMADHVYTALESFWLTLNYHTEQEGRQVQLFIRQENGDPLEYLQGNSWEPRTTQHYWSIASDRPYTGAKDDFRWRQEQIPHRISYRTYPNESMINMVAFYHVGPVTYDPKAREILSFLQAVMPKGYVDYTALAFNDPSDADMEFLKRTAFRATVNYGYTYESEQESALLDPIFRMEQHYFVLGRDLQWVAEQIFGEGVSIEHGSLGGKTWSYDELTGTYSHFPGGSGDEYLGGEYQVLLNYADHGETVTATIAWLGIDANNRLWVFTKDGKMKDFEMAEDYAPLDADALWDVLKNDTARAQVTLTKKPEGGYWFSGYSYLG